MSSKNSGRVYSSRAAADAARQPFVEDLAGRSAEVIAEDAAEFQAQVDAMAEPERCRTCNAIIGSEHGCEVCQPDGPMTADTIPTVESAEVATDAPDTGFRGYPSFADWSARPLCATCGADKSEGDIECPVCGAEYASQVQAPQTNVQVDALMNALAPLAAERGTTVETLVSAIMGAGTVSAPRLATPVKAATIRANSALPTSPLSAPLGDGMLGGTCPITGQALPTGNPNRWWGCGPAAYNFIRDAQRAAGLAVTGRGNYPEDSDRKNPKPLAWVALYNECLTLAGIAKAVPADASVLTPAPTA